VCANRFGWHACETFASAPALLAVCGLVIKGTGCARDSWRKGDGLSCFNHDRQAARTPSQSPKERPQHGQHAGARRWADVSQKSSHDSIIMTV
jgi:hypothetical protein